MVFEEKAEVLFERVKVGDVSILEIEWVNENNKLDPIFRLEHCEFEGIDDIEDGIQDLSTFTFTGRNEQFIDDGGQCDDGPYDYKGNSNQRRRKDRLVWLIEIPVHVLFTPTNSYRSSATETGCDANPT